MTETREVKLQTAIGSLKRILLAERQQTAQILELFLRMLEQKGHNYRQRAHGLEVRHESHTPVTVIAARRGQHGKLLRLIAYELNRAGYLATIPEGVQKIVITHQVV